MKKPHVLDEQIIKALESTMYTDEIRRAAYDLIMRQRREIEGLRMRIDALNHKNRILMGKEVHHDH
jgi:hypothetical protein